MFDFLTDPFTGEIGRSALAELGLLALVCGPLSVWVVLLRHSYAAESIAHATLPGLVLAALTGLPLILGAGVGILVAAIVIALAAREQRVGSDTAVAVAVTTLFGAGVIMALRPEVPARLGELLFGDPLSVTGAEIAATAALAVLTLGALGRLHRPLTLASFDSGAARSLGVPPGRAELGLLVLLAAATLVAVQALGNLLVVALLVGPGAAALSLTRRLPASLAAAAGLAALAGLAGIYASHYLDVAAGAAIALAVVAIYAVAAPFRLRRPRRLAPRRMQTAPHPSSR